jgi:hypothetical protein
VSHLSFSKERSQIVERIDAREQVAANQTLRGQRVEEAVSPFDACALTELSFEGVASLRGHRAFVHLRRGVLRLVNDEVDLESVKQALTDCIEPLNLIRAKPKMKESTLGDLRKKRNRQVGEVLLQLVVSPYAPTANLIVQAVKGNPDAVAYSIQLLVAVAGLVKAWVPARRALMTSVNYDLAAMYAGMHDDTTEARSQGPLQ